MSQTTLYLAVMHPLVLIFSRLYLIREFRIQLRYTMKRKEYKTLINAPRERVWEVLWGETSYNKWTSVFSPESRAQTDWQEGSKIYFLNGNNEGMVALIQKKIPNKYMSFKHLGQINKGVEDFDSDEVRKWAGSTENYTLETKNDQTELIVDMDIEESYLDFFDETWPKAMQKLRELAEGKEQVEKRNKNMS